MQFLLMLRSGTVIKCCVLWLSQKLVVVMVVFIFSFSGFFSVFCVKPQFSLLERTSKSLLVLAIVEEDKSDSDSESDKDSDSDSVPLSKSDRSVFNSFSSLVSLQLTFPSNIDEFTSAVVFCPLLIRIFGGIDGCSGFISASCSLAITAK